MVYAPYMVATISQVASEVGVRSDTIRYYERVGLLPLPDRSPNGYRSYSENDVERLRFIRGAQRLGLKLRDVRELLAIRDKGVCPCGHTARLVNMRLADLDAQIVGLKRLRGDMARLLETLPSDSVGEDEPWPCNVQFIRAGGGES
ncbi:MAG: heavy metal-responsive transcriptional regulator [Acidimicrobiia bacterium]